MQAAELVIFDSDGVLVDSEPIALAVLARAARAEGAKIDDADALSIFRGLKIADCVAVIEARAGRAVRTSFIDDVRRETARAFETSLKPIEGVHEALSRIRLQMCVASNGPSAKLAQTLALTGLAERFEGRVFSAYDVGAWKPDPGLFLHAALVMGAEPDRCVVIEDSVAGVEAATAAGMRAFGYAGDSPSEAAALAERGATVFTRMADLPGLLGSG